MFRTRFTNVDCCSTNFDLYREKKVDEWSSFCFWILLCPVKCLACLLDHRYYVLQARQTDGIGKNNSHRTETFLSERFVPSSSCWQRFFVRFWSEQWLSLQCIEKRNRSWCWLLLMQFIDDRPIFLSITIVRSMVNMIVTWFIRFNQMSNSINVHFGFGSCRRRWWFIHFFFNVYA